MIITIEGNIGAGKSTLAVALYEELKRVSNKTVHLIKEPVEEWRNLCGENLLQTFYEDKSRWGFTFQVNALTDAVANEFKAFNYSFDGDIVIMERSSFSVLKLFTKLLHYENNLQTMEQEIINKLSSTLPKFIELESKNAVVIYLKTDPEVCYERIMKRSREEEVGVVSLDYLKKLHIIHEQEVSAEKINGQLLILDGHKSSWKMEFENQENSICLNLNIAKENM